MLFSIPFPEPQGAAREALIYSLPAVSPTRPT
jgi:hypothetical protein